MDIDITERLLLEIPSDSLNREAAGMIEALRNELAMARSEAACWEASNDKFHQQFEEAAAALERSGVARMQSALRRIARDSSEHFASAVAADAIKSADGGFDA